MSRIRFVTLMLVVLLAVTPLAVLAQDDPQVEEFVSEDGLLTLSYPAGWFPYMDEDMPFPMVVFLNSEEAVERFMAIEENPVSGDQAFLVFVTPIDYLAFFGVTVTEDTTPADLVTTVATMFFETEPGEDGTVDEEDMIEIGEADEVELSEELVAGVVDVIDPTGEGTFMTFMPGERLLVIVYTVAYPGEFTDEQAEMAQALAASLVYEGTADALLTAIMTPPVVEEAPEGAASGDYDGAALIEERCSTCHTTAQIYSADKDDAGWAATVDRMIGYGAQLNSAEREAVLEYLIANH